MGLPPALHRKCCASNKSTFSPLLAFLGPACVLSFSATNRLVYRSFPTRSLTSTKKKKIVSTEFLRAHAGPSTMPHPGFAHFYSGKRCAHTKPFRSWALRLLALSQLSPPRPPSPPHPPAIGKPGKMIEPVCVAKRLASTGWGGGGEIEL